MAKTFEDLRVFKAVTELMVEVYRATEKYPKTKTYELVSQLRRASIGVLSHIGEGQGRLTWGEWRALRSDAGGFVFEIEAQLIASQRLGYLVPDTYKQLRVRTREVGGLLAGFIRYVKKREITAKAARTSSPSRQQATA